MITQPSDYNRRQVLRGISYKRFTVLAAGEFRCAYCGLDLLSNMDTLFGASQDHVRAKNNGGGDEPDNLVACCKSCNQLKGCAEVETIDEAREMIMQRRAEFLAGFIGRANQAGVEFPRGLEQLARFAPDIVRALEVCTAQAEESTSRLQAITRNAAAIEQLLERFDGSGLNEKSSTRS